MILVASASAFASNDESVPPSVSERVQALRDSYHQKRKLEEISQEQKDLEKRNFVPPVSFDSFTLTEADGIDKKDPSRMPAQSQ